MKFNRFAGIALALFAGVTMAQAQRAQDIPAELDATKTKYDYHELFAPFFYTKNGTEYRAASGEPGPKYWQNRADYQLSATLNDKTDEITGTEVLTYTNNSPQALGFIWMQLDQNLFKLDSRGSVIVPVMGSRNGGKGQVFDAGYKIKSVKVLNGTIATDVKFLINDTRMQVFLPKAIAPAGGQLKLKIEYSFISPNYGSDRMGYLPSKNGKSVYHCPMVPTYVCL